MSSKNAFLCISFLTWEVKRLHWPLALMRLEESVTKAYMNAFLFTISSDLCVGRAPVQYWAAFNWMLPSLPLTPVHGMDEDVQQQFSGSALLRSRALGSPVLQSLSVELLSHLSKELKPCYSSCAEPPPFISATFAGATTNLNWTSSASPSWNCAKAATHSVSWNWQCETLQLSWHLMRIIDWEAQVNTAIACYPITITSCSSIF